MKKKIISSIVATSLLLSSVSFAIPPQVQAAANITQANIIKSVNFRESPSTSGKRIRYLQKGETVEIINQVNQYWYYIKDKNGKKGYVTTMDQYIKVLPSSSNSVESKTNGEIIYGVNFRTGPGTSYNIIRMLKRGEKITILEKTNANWYKIIDKNGRTGYISSSSKYVKTNFSESNPSDPVESKTNGEIIYGVNFRTGPGTSYNIIRMLKRGEKITILEKTNANWYKIIDKNGRTGYISSSSKYVKTNFKQSNPVEKPNDDVSKIAQRVIEAGMKYLGTPYEFGSDRNSTKTFDCSAFVRRAFLDGAGITLPADSRKQAEYVKNIGKTTTDWRQLEPGDIMFFMDYKGSKKSNYSGIDKQKQRISHDGIYIGNGKILHTYSKESGGVRIDSIANTHWEYRFVFGGSALK